MRNLLRSASAAAMALVSLAARGQNAPAPAYMNGPGSTLSQSSRPLVPHSPPLPYGLQLMARFDLLPTLRDTKCVQDSSYDRSGGNGDSGNFLRRDGDRAVLADIRGPGCIYRFWSANAAGHLSIFFDDEPTPRVDCPMQDLFLARVAPFVSPLVGHRSGGWYCFFPIPFARHCRIEVTDPGSMYYHVEYQLFPDGTPVRTFTPQLTPADATALQTVQRQWAHLGEMPVPAAEEAKVSGSAPLAAGTVRTLATLRGPAIVDALRFQIAPADRLTLRQTVLRVYWDGAAKPGIEAPLGDFFGAGFGDLRFQALPDAMGDDGYVCYWPMPFARSARIEIAAPGRTDLPRVAWTVSYRKQRRPLADAGYFHAQWHRQTTVNGEHFHILQTSGRGHYVGEHTDMQGDRGIWFLEGDEKMYVDGETFPSIYGTGTEDFYTGGWYFDEGPFSLAYHGCTLKRDDMSRVAAYRYQIQDCVPFQRDIRVDIEHGPMNDYPGADYSCVAYWYQDAPSHDWSPIDPAQLTPARYKVAGALEAESLPWSGGAAEIRDDAALPIEASGGRFMALAGAAGGRRATVTLPVDHDDVYRLHIGELILPNSPPKLSIDWPDRPADIPVPDLARPADARERYDYVLTLRLKAGDHPLTLITPQGETRDVDLLLLEPVAHEHGVIEAEGLADQAMATAGVVARRDGIEISSRFSDAVMASLSGAGLLEWSGLTPGATLRLPLVASSDGDYELELGAAMLTAGPKLTASIDEARPFALDLSALPVDAPNAAGFQVRRVRMGRLEGLKQGAHILTLTADGGGDALRLDYLRLQRSRYPYALEAETLRVLDTRDGEATHQEMRGFGTGWSNDDQFWFLAQKAGAEATLELPVAQSGAYDLSAYYTTSRDYGISQVLVDGHEIGPPTDCYTLGVLARGKTALGRLDLTAGSHRITFRVTGKNPVSSGYLLGVDAIGLEPAK